MYTNIDLKGTLEMKGFQKPRENCFSATSVDY